MIPLPPRCLGGRSGFSPRSLLRSTRFRARSMDLPTCPACGQSVLDDDAVDCPFCGASLKGGGKGSAPKKPLPAVAKKGVPAAAPAAEAKSPAKPAAKSDGKTDARPTTTSSKPTPRRPKQSRFPESDRHQVGRSALSDVRHGRVPRPQASGRIGFGVRTPSAPCRCSSRPDRSRSRRSNRKRSPRP